MQDAVSVFLYERVLICKMWCPQAKDSSVWQRRRKTNQGSDPPLLQIRARPKRWQDNLALLAAFVCLCVGVSVSFFNFQGQIISVWQCVQCWASLYRLEVNKRKSIFVSMDRSLQTQIGLCMPFCLSRILFLQEGIRSAQSTCSIRKMGYTSFNQLNFTL